MGESREKVIVLFDVDGTLTKPRQAIEEDFRTFLVGTLKKVTCVGLVGGSDLSKISEQMGGDDALKDFDYVFAENGVVAMKNGQIFSKQSIADCIGEDALQQFINGCLEYMSKLQLPKKRGTFIEYRTGLINICPIGRNCSQEERDAFEEYDKENQVRSKFVSFLKEKFASMPLQYAIGGQISFDVYPKGWDKSYCLQFLSEFDKIYFCGDKCEVGGNDYALYSHPRVKGFKVQGPHVTKEYSQRIFETHSSGGVLA